VKFVNQIGHIQPSENIGENFVRPPQTVFVSHSLETVILKLKSLVTSCYSILWLAILLNLMRANTSRLSAANLWIVAINPNYT